MRSYVTNNVKSERVYERQREPKKCCMRSYVTNAGKSERVYERQRELKKRELKKGLQKGGRCGIIRVDIVCGKIKRIVVNTLRQP